MNLRTKILWKMIWHAITKWHWTGTITYDDGKIIEANCDHCNKIYYQRS